VPFCFLKHSSWLAAVIPGLRISNAPAPQNSQRSFQKQDKSSVSLGTPKTESQQPGRQSRWHADAP